MTTNKKTPFERGYRTTSDVMGAKLKAIGGVKYIHNIEDEIDNLEYLMNVVLRFNKDGTVNKTEIESQKGYAAEYWHSGTHNIDAAVNDVSSRVEVRSSRVVGAPDVVGNWDGADFGLKYYKRGSAAGEAQAITYREKYELYRSNVNDGGQPLSYDEYFKNQYDIFLRESEIANRPTKSIDEVFPGFREPNNPLYTGQFRVIAKDQIEEAQKWLRRRIIEESNGGRSEQALRYQNTLDMLTDKVKSSEGSESIPLTKAEAKELVILSREGEFNPADWGLTPQDLIEWQNIMKQAQKAGRSAAVVSVVLEVAPELLKIMMKLFQDGEVDIDDFKRTGFAALRGSTLGYVRGSVAAAITISCKSGKWGVLLKNTDPTIIGAVVALTMNAVQNATLMAFGQISNHEFATRCIHDLFTTSCSLAIGAALQSFLPQLPVLGYMLGSFIGGVIGSFTYQTVYSCAMTYFVDTGCTFFGLVKQDYTLPKEIKEELGLTFFEYENIEYEKVEYEKLNYETIQYAEIEYIQLNIRILRRGVIGINTIGYIT